MRRFTTDRHGRQRMEFFAAPFRAPLRAFAAMVFPWVDGKLLICDIVDRGWCIPSGRVEPGESSCEAAAREAIEEAGAVLQDLQYIGCYRISERNEVRWADVFVATVPDLVEIQCPEESQGRKLVAIDELSSTYYHWSPLTSEVCAFSREILERQLRLDERA